MQFDKNAIADYALAINQRHEIIHVSNEPVCVKFYGRRAMFSDPAFKTEKMTFPAPTFAALRNMIQAIYWHPGMDYIPVFCGIRNPIKMESTGINGVKDIKKAKLGTHVDVTSVSSVQQRTWTYLMDVEYYVMAYITYYPNEMHNSDSIIKYSEIVNGRIEKGQCNKGVFLGTRECLAHFEPLTPADFDNPNKFIKHNEDMGLVPFDFNYTNPEKPIPIYQWLKIKHGQINYVENGLL